MAAKPQKIYSAHKATLFSVAYIINTLICLNLYFLSISKYPYICTIKEKYLVIMRGDDDLFLTQEHLFKMYISQVVVITKKVGVITTLKEITIPKLSM